MASLGELFVELGFVGDTKQLEDFVNKVNNAAKATEQQGKKQQKTNNTVGNAIRKIRNFALAVSATFYALNRLTDSLVAQNQAFLNFTRQTDINLRTMQKWAGVGAIVDKSLGEQGVAGTIESLNKRLFEMRLTGEGARGFILAGINPSGNAEDVLEQLRNRIRGMNNTQATWLLEQMGIDPRMITLLRMSREEFNEYSQAVQKFQLTLEQRQAIDRMNRQLQIARMQLQYLKDKAVLALMPYLIKLTQITAKFADGLYKVVSWIKNSKNGWASLVRIIGLVAIQLTAVVAITKTFTSLIKAMPLLVDLIGNAFSLLAKHPAILAIIAIIDALYLLIDDFMTYQKGGLSVTGAVLSAIGKKEQFLPSPQNTPYLTNSSSNVSNNTTNNYNNFTSNANISTSQPVNYVAEGFARMSYRFANMD